MKVQPITTDITKAGPWLTTPDGDIRLAFAEHRKTSPFPEHFDGVIRSGRYTSEEIGNYSIVEKNIEVSLKDRDDQMTPCSVCGPFPKWLHGGYLIKNETGWLFLIGPQCGDKHFDGFVQKDREHDRHQERERGWENLVSNGHLIEPWIDYGNELLSHAKIAQNAKEELLKSGHDLLKHLREAFKKYDGWLRVEEPINAESQKYGITQVSFIRGKFALLTGKRSNLYWRLSSALDALEDIYPDQLAYEDYVLETYNNWSSWKTWKTIGDSIDEIKLVARDIRSTASFFESANYDSIREWAKHPYCPIKFGVLNSGHNRVLLPRSASRRHLVDVSELFKELPPEPDDLS